MIKLCGHFVLKHSTIIITLSEQEVALLSQEYEEQKY